MAGRVLLVEDEPELLRALVIRMSAAGFSCQTAGNGREGLHVLARWRPDLVIADLAMPVMDGYEMIRQMKADPQTAAIPIIVLTAVPEQTRASRAEELQGLRVMSKPFDSNTLLAAVRDQLAPGAPGGSHDG